MGDYLLSKSVLLSTDNKDFDLLAVISRTIREMAEGELLQLEKLVNWILQKMFITKLSVRKPLHLSLHVAK